MKIIRIKSIAILLLILLPLVIVAGLRPIGIDHDSLTYASVLSVPFGEFSFYDKEPFFWIIVYINQIIFPGNAQTFFLIFALFGVSLKLYAVKQLSLFPILSYISYILLYFILHEMTQIRAGVAAAIFLLAIPDVVNKNFKYFFIKTILAFSFHYSAIFMFLVYFFNPSSFQRIFYFVFPIFGMALAFLKSYTLILFNVFVNLFPAFISDKLNVYLILLGEGQYSDINIFNFYYLSILMFYFLLVVNYRMLKSKYDLVFLKILGLSLFLYYALSAVPVFAIRISELFGVVLILLIPHALFLFKQKFIVSIPIAVWMIVYFLTIMIGRNLRM